MYNRRSDFCRLTTNWEIIPLPFEPESDLLGREFLPIEFVPTKTFLDLFILETGPA